MFAVPGEITPALSAGTNGLLRLGASALTCPPTCSSRSGWRSGSVTAPAVSPSARAVFERLGDAPASADELARVLAFDAGTVAAALAESSTYTRPLRKVQGSIERRRDHEAMRAVVIVALLLVLAVPAGATPGPAAHVKNTNGWVETVAMDGSRLAYAVKGGAACTKVFVWNVGNGSAAPVSGRGTCAADSTSTGGGVTEVAVAGTRLAWIVNMGGNTESTDVLFTASVPRPHARCNGLYRDVDDDGAASPRRRRGGGRPDRADQFTTNAAGTIAKASLRRLDGQLTTIAAGNGTLRPASLDGHRIAVVRVDQKVALYDTETGRVLLTVTPSSAREVALRKDYVVVLTSARSIEIFNAKTGAPVRALRVAAGAAKLDVHSGIAVYAVGRPVHALRLAYGKEAVMATAPREIAAFAVEPPDRVRLQHRQGNEGHR